MRRFLTLALLALSASPALAQDAAEEELVRAMFLNLNPQSVEHDREICGFVVRDARGVLQISKASWGGNASCASLPVPPGVQIVSSWHTHAAWALGYDGEVPSTIDVEGDMQMRVNGWLATPGGRIWYIDGATGDMHQVCGRDCLPADPNFFPEEHGPVEKEYTLAELRARFGG